MHIKKPAESGVHRQEHHHLEKLLRVGLVIKSNEEKKIVSSVQPRFMKSSIVIHI
jgi:hypothetical protein